MNKRIQANEEGYIQGYASVFHIVDSQGDCIKPGAFKNSLFSHKQGNTWPKMLWQHDQSAPIGIWTHLQEDDYGLYVEGRLLLTIPLAHQAYVLLTHQGIDGLSIGFYTQQASRQGSVRHILMADLIEISIVTFAANRQAKALPRGYPHQEGNGRQSIG